MNIRVNGDPLELPGELTILQLLERLQIDPRRVAVEHNLTIVKRVRYETTTIREGDEIEIVNFVGGGAARACRLPLRSRVGPGADRLDPVSGN